MAQRQQLQKQKELAQQQKQQQQLQQQLNNHNQTMTVKLGTTKVRKVGYFLGFDTIENGNDNFLSFFLAINDE